MNSYYAEWQSSRWRKTACNSAQSLKRSHVTDSCVSFASFAQKSKDPLSKLVWEKNHSIERELRASQTPHSLKSTTNRTDFATSSGRQSSYELELLNRRLNILGDGFLDSGGDPWTPIEVVISPASSDLLGPEYSDDSNYEIPLSPGRKAFVSLRGLPGLYSDRTRSSSAEKVEKRNTDSARQKSNGFFFVTEKPGASADKEATETRDMASQGEAIPQTHVVSIPVDRMQENESMSHDKGTSPLQVEEDAALTKAEITTSRKVSRPKDTPRYPYETGSHSKGKKLNRPSIHNGLLRTHRLHDYSRPAVVSSTQQLLCLTPSRVGFITLGSDEDASNLHKVAENIQPTVQVKRFNENENSATPPMGVPKTTASARNASFRLMQRDGSSRPCTSVTQRQSFTLANLHYKHTSQIRKPYRYPALSPAERKPDSSASKTPNFERNATAMSMNKHSASTAYRIIENHIKWNRRLPVFHPDEVANVYPYQPSFNYQNPATQARKMAPVLRVIPAFPRKTTVTKAPKVNKPPKSPVDTEPASQKKVRFSDQIGLPLVRNATPNYRRKHSYILRWLETAGRPAKSIPLV